MSPKKKSTAIGLDISNSSVKVAEIEIDRGDAILTNLGIIHLPEGIIRDGEIEDPESLSNLIKDLWARSGIKGKKVTLGIANQKVIVRPMDLPYMPEDELENAVKYQVQEFIPIPIDDAIIDYEVVDEYMTGEEERMQTILLAAAHREMITAFLDVCVNAGLQPEAIELKAFAMVRALVKQEYQLEEEGGAQEAPASSTSARASAT